MRKVRSCITLREGVAVELLVTPALQGVAARRHIAIDDSVQGTELLLRLIYCAAISAWDAETVDAPEAGDFPHKYIDFAEWAAADVDAFRKTSDFVLVALTGKDAREWSAEAAKAVKSKKKE